MSPRRPRPIAASDDCSEFTCGDNDLDTWLRIRALKNEATGASRTFITVDADTSKVLGYYCLSSSALLMEEAPGRLRRNMPNPIPVVLIGRLAVDSSVSRQGIGAALLQDAALRSLEASRSVGMRAMVVHAASDDAQAFYKRWGFTMFEESTRAMYLTIQDAEASLASLAS